MENSPNTDIQSAMVSSSTPNNSMNVGKPVPNPALIPNGPATTDAYTQLTEPSVNSLASLLAQQDFSSNTAPSTGDFNDIMYEFRMNGAETSYNEVDANSIYNMGGGTSARSESVISNRGSGLWSEPTASTPQSDRMQAFDFLIKSVSAANSYLSMLTSEQLMVLQSIRPGLLHELMLDIAKVRREKRMRRALPNECAFCKNNGESEGLFTSHSLKDWHGRVTCPVLRAFRCPRCGATGDRAHTIKYCPENANPADRSGQLSPPRRRVMVPSATSPLMQGTQMAGTPSVNTPVATPTTTYNNNPLWFNFGENM